MSPNKEEEKFQYKKPEINKDNGLSIGYDKEEFKNYFPSISKEISLGKKSLTMEGIDFEVEETGQKKKKQEDKKESPPDNLKEPGVTDFLRRCKTKDEAVEILDYLLKREEISKKEYGEIIKRISKKNGLKQYIKESGGFKRPGYYIRKYYNKQKNITKASKD